MKLQHFAIIFAIIFLPIILITSYYIQRQVDTVNLQLSYDSDLLDATYDAMSAFEINTANEDLSTVSDSLRSIITASNNIFLSTLATNLGYSNAGKSFVQPYIPAVIYTLYDGYYIYAPESTPIVCTDEKGQTITTSDYGVTYSGSSDGIGKYSFNQSGITYIEGTTEASDDSSAKVEFNSLPEDIKPEYGQLLYKNKDGSYSTVLHSGGIGGGTEYTQDYVLKSYVPYSAKYKQDGVFDVTINYTLDNFISITGTIGETYYSKSGYLIADGLVSITIDGGAAISWDSYSEEDLMNIINLDEDGNGIADHLVTVAFNDRKWCYFYKSRYNN